MEFSNIDTLTVKSGVLIPKSLNEDVNIEIQEDGTLDYQKKETVKLSKKAQAKLEAEKAAAEAANAEA